MCGKKGSGGGTSHGDGPLKNVLVVVIRRHGERVGVPRTTLGPEPFQRIEVAPLRSRRARLRVPPRRERKLDEL